MVARSLDAAKANEQNYKPTLRPDSNAVAIQLRVVSKCFGTDSPQTVGSFPHMTDAAWLDWISRFNDFISADFGRDDGTSK